MLFASAPLLGHGGYHQEIQRLDEQIAEHPDDGEIWFHRGRVKLLHGEWQDALTDLEKAERLVPGRFPVDWVRGDALVAAGKLDAARAVLDDFLASHCNHGGALLSRARLLAKMEMKDAAQADYCAALQHTPNAEPDLFLEVSDALARMKRNDEAIQVLETGMQKLGRVPGLLLKALELELGAKHFDAALARIEAMQKTSQRPEPWMVRRAEVLLQAGRRDEARAAWQELQDHIATLTDQQRGSHAMSVLAETVSQSLAQFDQISPPTSLAPAARSGGTP